MIVPAYFRLLRRICFALFLALTLIGLSAAQTVETPKEAWQQAILEQNKSYAETPHAVLKVQDSVYLADGQTAKLVGRVGEPASWHWSLAADAPANLSISFQSGRLSVLHAGRPLDPAQVERGIFIDKYVDVVGHSTQVTASITGWRIFVYNQESPVAQGFTGVSYFAYDPSFRVTARFLADTTLPPRVFRTSRGTDKQFYHTGDAVFTLAGKAVTLPFYADANDPKKIKEMSAFFTDELTGNGAYGAGRYVDIQGIADFPPSTIVIDLNQAYNPNCARSPHFACPIAVDSIDLPVTAGERDPHAAQ